MRKIIILIVSILLGINGLHANTNSISNFKVSESCLVDIQNKRDSSINQYYTGLVFSKDVTTARKSSNQQIMKKINLLIGSTSTLFYKEESSSENGIYLKEILTFCL